MIKSHIIYQFYKNFTNHRKEANRVVVFSSRHFPNILNYKDHQRDLPIIWKAIDMIIRENVLSSTYIFMSHIMWWRWWRRKVRDIQLKDSNCKRLQGELYIF